MDLNGFLDSLSVARGLGFASGEQFMGDPEFDEYSEAEGDQELSLVDGLDGFDEGDEGEEEGDEEVSGEENEDEDEPIEDEGDEGAVEDEDEEADATAENEGDEGDEEDTEAKEKESDEEAQKVNYIHLSFASKPVPQ